MRIGRLRDMQRGEQVQLQDAFGKARAGRCSVGLRRSARIVDDKVDAAMARDKLGNPVGHRRRIANVAGCEFRRLSIDPNRFFRRGAPAGRNRIALRQQTPHNRRAYAARAACDDCKLANTRFAHGPILSVSRNAQRAHRMDRPHTQSAPSFARHNAVVIADCYADQV